MVVERPVRGLRTEAADDALELHEQCTFRILPPTGLPDVPSARRSQVIEVTDSDP